MSTASSTEITKVIKDLAVTDTKSVSADIKNTILFQTNWETLLTSAPIAIGALGACCVAANSPHLDRVELAPPASGKFTYLKWLDVSTNLLQCVDEGRSAFDVAHGSMNKIWDMVLMVDKTVIRIISTLVDPQGTKDNLLDYMEELRNTADLCAKESVSIDDKFDKYLQFIKELSQACEQQQGLTSSAIKNTARDLKAENVRLAGQERATQAAEGLAKRMEKELTVASEAYKKASDEFPSGWDIVGQEAVKGLVDCVTTVVNTSIPVLMEQLSPMKKVQAATNILGDLATDAVDAAKNIQNGLNTTPAAAGVLQSSAQFVADPAFSQIKKDMIWFNLLKEVLPAVPGGGVDWDKAKNEQTAGKAKGKTFLSVVESGFVGATDAFRNLATDSEPSTKYAAALEGINEVVSDMKREIAEGEKSGAYIPPKAGNPMVDHWNDAFAEHYQTAIELCSVSTSFPGNAPGGFPSVNPSATSTQKDISKSLGVMEGATNRLRMTRDALIATQNNYLQSETLLIESRTKMADIQATITKLQSSTLKLDQVLEILKQSIKMVGAVKNNIAKLCRFFDAMATLITVMVTQQVQPFVKNLDTNLRHSEDGLVGALSWSDSQKQVIYQSIVTIRSYFSAYGDVAGMWVKLSSENIIEGMDLLADVFAAAQEGESAAKARELEDWSGRAQANIAKIARETQSKMKSDMQARVERFAKETARLPEAPKAAIEGLNKASKVAARAGMRMLEEAPNEIVPTGW